MATDGSADPLPAEQGTPSGERYREIDDLVGIYINSLNAGEELSAEKIIEDHPRLGAEILRELETFIQISADKHCSGTLGDYRLLKQVGRGGMGVVYEAWQDSMDRG